LLFYHIIESTLVKKIILATSSAAGLYTIYELLTGSFKSGFSGFDSIPSGISSLIVLVYSITYLFQRVKDTDALFLYASPNFWIVISFMTYAAGTFFPFLYAKSYLNEEQFVYDFDLIHGTLYILRNIIFAVAMLTRGKPVEPKHLSKKKKQNTTSFNP